MFGGVFNHADLMFLEVLNRVGLLFGMEMMLRKECR